ncbi:MAG: PepSY domain-containing protein [Porphyromonas sp.]|uniref:PepSY-associated TM helix domain-containing protein n=1 Tax=Porphyromonas sp. TaxID=1924944 RepID=UPI001CAE618C|nr:PepSY-associated TM helix domain-containing protein [Porphyromonas sp.]MBF1405214.1 PepSY domain-containing protein [Porphyromonas sp.]
MTVRKLFKKLHLWLSLPFGLIIMTTCLTGALLVFEKEITELVRHDSYTIPVRKTQSLSLQSLLERVARETPDSVQITSVTIPSDFRRAYTVGLSKPRRAGVLVDPYTGKIVGQSGRLPFFTTVRELHRWLLDSMKPDSEGIFWGRVIVGTSTLLFVFILLTGLFLWWPKKLKGIGKRLKISLGHGRQRLFYDLHTVGGVYVFVLLLAMAMTGLTWSFEWYRTGFYKVFGAEMAEAGKGDKGPKKDKRKDVPREEGTEQAKLPASYIYWEEVVEYVIEVSEADYTEITVKDGEVEVPLAGLGNIRAADSFRFDKKTGQVTEYKAYREVKRDKKLRGWIYSIHTGAWGGLFTRICYVLAALFGASLPLTGYYIFYQRKWGKKRKAKGGSKA